MADIARQTVEFLYEENGGIPGDLVLPTIEDVKEEMSKFTMDKIKKGDMVKLKGSHQGDRGQEAAFSCLAQLKTFGLHGEVFWENFGASPPMPKGRKGTNVWRAPRRRRCRRERRQRTLH